jgi:metal-dependent amidase/aminoacylase/carboxypeptidase family protein
LTAGTAFNIIPDIASLEGTVRAHSDSTRSEILSGIRRVADGITAAHLCHADVEIVEGYPRTVNDASMAELTLTLARGLVGADRVAVMNSPVMGAEDWSYVLQMVPGTMAYLGVAPPGVEQPAPNHSSRMVLDEEAFPTGVALHAAMAMGSL